MDLSILITAAIIICILIDDIRITRIYKEQQKNRREIDALMMEMFLRYKDKRKLGKLKNEVQKYIKKLDEKDHS